MEPNQNSTPTPTPTPADPVVELVSNQRQNVAYTLLFVALVFLVVTVMLGLKGSRITAAPDADKTQQKDKDAEDPLKALQLEGGDVTQPNRSDYLVGAVGAALGALLCMGAGLYLVARPAPPTPSQQRTEARSVILGFGGLLGAALIVVGAAYFYLWSESLVKWLDKGELGQARWVMIPLLMIVAGGGLMFLSGMPARAEERNNATIRKLVYGSNFGLTTLMLFVVLVIVNAVVAMRVPNKLDTTSTNFYSLNPQTKQLIESLEQPIHAYAILQEGGDINTDAKRLLQSCQDVNPSKFQVTFYSPAMNKAEINKLKADYPMAEMSREGILLVAGEESSSERKRHTFIRDDELGDEKMGSDGRPVLVFNGEPRLLRELMFLAENKQRPKIYFTQSSGELALNPGGRSSNAQRTAAGLKNYLEKNYFDVVPLNFELAGPATIPNDAAVVVVADPIATLPPNGVEAIRKYMTELRPDGKKGKLVLLAGSQVGPDRRPLKTGLEPVLQMFGVRLSDRFLYGQPVPQLGDLDHAEGTRVSLAMITQEAVEARNPVALGFNKVERLPLLDCREVSAAPTGAAQPVTVLASQPGRLTWTEAEYPGSPPEAWRSLNARVEQIFDGPGDRDAKQKQVAQLLAQAQLSKSPRELAVFVSEGPTARVAVFGCGWFVSDDASGRAAGFGRGQLATVWLDLVGSTLDWIRDRPTVTGVTEKPYTTYTLKPGYSQSRLVWLPIGLSVLAVLGLGAGVWVVRRR